MVQVRTWGSRWRRGSAQDAPFRPSPRADVKAAWARGEDTRSLTTQNWFSFTLAKGHWASNGPAMGVV